MKKPRWLIREIDGECVVHLYDKDNCLLLTETMSEGQDPYLFIPKIRESVEQAEITEFPKLSLPKSLPEETKEGYVNILKEQITTYEKTIAGLREYIAKIEQPEHSFTEGL
jgi:hypothetical protein